jgi:hypothetical protein
MLRATLLGKKQEGNLVTNIERDTAVPDCKSRVNQLNKELTDVAVGQRVGIKLFTRVSVVRRHFPQSHSDTSITVSLRNLSQYFIVSHLANRIYRLLLCSQQEYCNFPNRTTHKRFLLEERILSTLVRTCVLKLYTFLLLFWRHSLKISIVRQCLLLRCHKIERRRSCETLHFIYCIFFHPLFCILRTFC